MKLPHRTYLKTLVAGKLTNQEIFKDHQQHSLAVPPPKDVDALREQLKLGQEEYFKGTETVDLSWLNDLGVEAMFGYRFKKQVTESIEPILGAFRVLDDRNMYRTITALAMANVTNEDIELIVNGKYDIEYSSDELDTFLHYFFDLKGWSYYEKNDYANAISDKALRTFYKMALEEDKDFLMWKLGIAPNKSFDAMLRDMAIDSYYNFKEQSSRNQDQAFKWGTLTIKVQERLDKIEQALTDNADSREDLQEIFTNIVVAKTKSTKKIKETVEETPEPFSILQPGTNKPIPKIVNLEDLN